MKLPIASSTSAGILSNVSQNMAGAKTFYNAAGSTVLGSYSDTGVWTLGANAGTAGTHTLQAAAGGGWTAIIQATNAAAPAGSSNGLLISAGMAASDTSFSVSDRSASTNYGNCNGVGAWTFGPTTGAVTHTFRSGAVTRVDINSGGTDSARLHINAGGGSGVSFLSFDRAGARIWEQGYDSAGPGGTNGFYWYNGSYVGGISQSGAWTLGPSTATRFVVGSSVFDAHVYGQTSCWLNINSASTTNDSGIRLNESGGSSTRWHIYANPADQIRISDNGDDHGTFMSQGSVTWSSISDERVKENWIELTNALANVLTLRAGTYNRISAPDRRQVGLIAQDVLAVQPEAVDTTDPNMLGLRYSEVIPLLVKAIQELKQQFDEYVATHP